MDEDAVPMDSEADDFAENEGDEGDFEQEGFESEELEDAVSQPSLIQEGQDEVPDETSDGDNIWELQDAARTDDCCA